jgi:hypothetical protein
MTATFGYESYSSENAWEGYVIQIIKDGSNADLVCPGSGAQTIVSFGALMSCAGSDSGNIRCAIYNSSRGLVCQWPTHTTIPASAVAWREQTSGFVDYNSNPVTTLTGGDVYRLAVTVKSISGLVRGKITSGATSGVSSYIATDYDTGFPSTIAAGTNYTVQYCLRCVVEDAPAGGKIPVIMHHFKELRG